MITSADGTAIDHRTTGSGPGLVVVPGPMESATDCQGLADALADDFTVHVVDRRAGRGLSAEVEDISAVARATGAQRLFGISSGAVIALQAALRLPGITHVAACEPPIDLAKRKGKVIARFNEELAAGRHHEAMTTLVKGLEVGPGWLRLLPRKLFVTVMRKAEDDPDSLAERLLAVRHDFQIVEEGSANLKSLGALRGKVLLIGCTKSPRYLTDGFHELAELLPCAEKVLVEEAGYVSPSKSPHLVAPALKAFFLAG